MKRTKTWVIIGIVFIIFLFIITVYSRTIYQWQLPKVKIEMAKTSQTSCSVPLKAIHTDSNGKEFLLLLKQQTGAWGKEYICVRQYITTALYTESYAVLKGIGELKYPVIISSDKQIKHGSIVRIYP